MAQALPLWLGAHFDLPGVPNALLLRAYTNDVFLVRARNDRYVLKVYGAGWRRDSEIRFEIDLLRHLACHGVRVALPIPGKNDDALQVLTMHGEPRQAVLFEYAAGEKPRPPFSPAMYEREGMAVAALHSAADDFVTTHERRPLDLTALIDDPLSHILTIDVDAAVIQTIVEFGRQVRAQLDSRIAAGLDWGICHGDLTFDNLHITEGGDFVWYDLDSGGYGWRALDIQGWAYGRPEWRARWQAFLKGYREVRPLNDNDIAAAPFLCAAQDVWGIKVDLQRRLLGRGATAVHHYLSEQAATISERQRQLACFS